MIINGVELEFDILDAEMLERYENALKKQKEERKDTEGLSAVEVIRTQCDQIYTFFDDIFGRGMGEQIFSGKKNLRLCLEAVEALNQEINVQNESYTEKFSKYDPERLMR